MKMEDADDVILIIIANISQTTTTRSSEKTPTQLGPRASCQYD